MHALIIPKWMGKEGSFQSLPSTGAFETLLAKPKSRHHFRTTRRVEATIVDFVFVLHGDAYFLVRSFKFYYLKGAT